MTDKTRNIASVVMSLFVALVFFFGIYAWKHQPVDLMIKGKKLYYISIASVLYMSSIIGFILSKIWWAKAATSSLSSLFAVNLYQEVRFGNQAWEVWSYWFIVIAAGSYFILYILADKLKK